MFVQAYGATRFRRRLAFGFACNVVENIDFSVTLITSDMKYVVAVLLGIAMVALCVRLVARGRGVFVSHAESVTYGQVVHVREGDTLQFPDFRITFRGKTSAKSDVAQGLSSSQYDFIVATSDGKEQVIMWSSGTGEVVPLNFAVGNTVYQVELKFSEKTGASLADNEMVVAVSSHDISKYVFQLVSKLSAHMGEQDFLARVLGYTFAKGDNSNQYTNILVSSGFGPINHVEFRIDAHNSHKSLLVLKLDATTGITDKAITATYPNATMVVHEPEDPVRVSFEVPESWGKLSFGFDQAGMLTNIIFDTTGA